METFRNLNKDNEVYDVYPGNFNFSKHIRKSVNDKHRMRRLKIWKNYETDKPKDEVQGNCLSVSSANLIKALFIGKKIRKNIAFEHKKQYCLEQAKERVKERRIREKHLIFTISKLIEEKKEIEKKMKENEKEKKEIEKEKKEIEKKMCKDAIKNHIDYTLLTRQNHHLRTKGKLISDN